MSDPIRQAGYRTLVCGLGFRHEVEADLRFLSALYASTRVEELAPVPWSAEQKAAFLAQQFEAQRSHYRQYHPDASWLIVEHANAAIGRLYMDGGSNELRIIDIALMPEARGKGFGTALLEDIIEEAIEAGKSVSIHVERMNPALSLYQRLGFREIEDKGVYLLMEHPGGQADPTHAII